MVFPTHLKNMRVRQIGSSPQTLRWNYESIGSFTTHRWFIRQFGHKSSIHGSPSRIPYLGSSFRNCVYKLLLSFNSTNKKTDLPKKKSGRNLPNISWRSRLQLLVLTSIPHESSWLVKIMRSFCHDLRCAARIPQSYCCWEKVNNPP